MINMKKGSKRAIRVLIFALIIVLGTTLIPVQDFDMADEASAATTYSYTRTKFIKGDGDITSKFKLKRHGGMVGLCAQGGPMSASSGKATTRKLNNTGNLVKLAYYYGHLKKYTNGANGCDLARAFHYARFKTAYHQSAAKSRRMIEAVRNVKVPDNFVAYLCKPTNGYQEFLAWKLLPETTLILTKKSSDEIAMTTGEYSFKGITYSIYKEQSESSGVLAEMVCGKGGITDSISLPPGTYYIREKAGNEFFKWSDRWHKIILESGKVNKLTVSDEPETGDLTFNKVVTGASDGSAEGFRFTLTCRDNPALTYNAQSGKDGIVTFSDIYLGTYILTEKLTPGQISDGYSSLTGQIEVDIDKGGNSLPASATPYKNYKEPPPQGLIITKRTEDRSEPGGFTFRITCEENGFDERATTDKKGVIRYTGIEAGNYTVTEILTDAQKKIYRKPAAVTKSVSGEGVTVFEFENRLRTTPVQVEKSSVDGYADGIEFTLTGTDVTGKETSLRDVTIDGKCDFGGVNLLPGDYVIEETGFNAEKYTTDKPLNDRGNPVASFKITGSESGTKKVEFENLPYCVKLKKTECLEDGSPSGEPLADASYTLYEAGAGVDTGLEEPIGNFTTDENGEFIAYLAKGDYELVEEIPPAGYVEKEDVISFSIDEENPQVKITDTNRRSYGQVYLEKSNVDEEPVPGTEFTLFDDAECTEAAQDYKGNRLVSETDDYGRIWFDGLKWGTYYLKETKPTRGYFESDEVREINIGSGEGGTSAEFRIVNEQKPGTVILEKQGDTEDNLLDGAVFNLCRTDGTLVAGGLVTGSGEWGEGRIVVKNLPWGGYYFQETTAPAGYRINSEPVRFSVNSLTGGETQQVVAVNKPEQTEVVATKKVLANTLHFDHGTPTFIFELTGTTVDGEEKKYRQPVTFSGTYAEAHTDTDGYISASATFSGLKAGSYNLSEVQVIRYEPGTITAVTNGQADNKTKTVHFENLGDDAVGLATFTNNKSNWSGYSDTENFTNMVKEQRMLTAIVADYEGPEILEGNSYFSRDCLKVHAIYDDGTSRVLDDDEYELLNGDGTQLLQISRVAGRYTGIVRYSENGLARNGTFDYRVSPASRVTVTFNTMGGTELRTLEVFKWDSLDDYAAEKRRAVWLINGTGVEKYRFADWYITEELRSSDLFPVTEPISEDITLYAKWEDKHISDFTWAEISEISTLSTEPVSDIFGECFNAVRTDLATDGSLMQATLDKHTKAFTFGGHTCHAIIAGFNQDSTEGLSSITFMVYEKVDSGVMNDSRDDNPAGWADSRMRIRLNSSVYDSLPVSLRNVIKPVVKKSAALNGGLWEINETEDRLWLPSQVELYGAYGYEMVGGGPAESIFFPGTEFGRLRSMAGEGEIYPLFAGAVPDGLNLIERVHARGYGYWTRSLNVGTGREFCIVTGGGGADVE